MQRPQPHPPDEAMLDSVEVRLLGVLAEKEALTPDIYPLSLNALTIGCNQLSSRDPVMALSEDAVLDGLQGLIQKKLVSEVRQAGARVAKYEHRMRIKWTLEQDKLAVLTLLQNGLSVAVIELGVTPVSPALFSLDENGAGQVIALNQDGSLNTALNPASANTWVTLFLTGCGSFTPMGATGDVFPPIQTGQLVLPVQAAMQGKPATVGYAGPAPGMINSVSVVVVRVPNAVVANPRTGLSLGFGGQWTPETVQIAVTP